MATQQKNVLIFGGTGPTGLLVVKKTLDHGHIVTVYVRNEAKLSGDIKAHANIKIVKGELSNVELITSAVEGQDVVVSVLGPQLNSKTVPGIFTNAYGTIVAAMKQHNVTRILALGTISILDPKDNPTTFRTMMVGSIKLTHRDAWQAIIDIGKFFDEEGDGVQWTIYRVAGLANGVDEQVTTTYSGEPDCVYVVNRIAIARWLVDQIESSEPRYIKEKPYICTQGLHLWQMRI